MAFILGVQNYDLDCMQLVRFAFLWSANVLTLLRNFVYYKVPGILR